MTSIIHKLWKVPVVVLTVVMPVLEKLRLWSLDIIFIFFCHIIHFVKQEEEKSTLFGVLGFLGRWRQRTLDVWNQICPNWRSSDVFRFSKRMLVGELIVQLVRILWSTDSFWCVSEYFVSSDILKNPLSTSFFLTHSSLYPPRATPHLNNLQCWKVEVDVVTIVKLLRTGLIGFSEILSREVPLQQVYRR